MKKNIFLGISDEGFHNVAYTEWGSSDLELPAVLCVHGYTRNSHDFDALAYYLSMNGRHVFCPDVVGRGDSSWFKHSHHYNFTQYLSDMNALIARTKAQQIDWIGTSMGGLIGMMMAALPNSPVQRLILNDIGPQIPIFGLRRLAKYAGKEPEFKSIDEAKQFYKLNFSGFGALTDKQWDEFTARSIEEVAPGRFIAKVDPGIKNPKSSVQVMSEFFHHPYKAMEGILYDIDLWSVWQKVHCPVLVIHGTQSDLLTPEIIKRMQRSHNKTDVFEIKDAGHAPALLNTTEHETIMNWLTSTR
ncbi:alpha/beta fold hydrolase [Legionella bononiensis]|uniref:Alpha/beta hydrolase n=1 Tax=Legionella bononiensis TaxID=2793102 RepID=A0ABS1WEF5_9GAMM|nr:alpha/beta hydrolase [Legionella bononiensis]MBL7479380.1 alpha/beta hydrolase [Legionella bononiensis]MBL7527746.1 alpha/beta hydrolase [Legionella bononiensis]MBL7563571.1 alpha/beta hydrolase [Legionella bononiensis]